MNLIRLDPEPTLVVSNEIRIHMRFTLMTTNRRPFGYGIIVEELNKVGSVVREQFLKIPYDEESQK